MSHVNAVQQENRSMVALCEGGVRARVWKGGAGVVLVLWTVCFAPKLQAQRQFNESKEIGMAVGTGYYLGDINPYSHFGGRLHASAGGFFRYNITPRISVRANVVRGTVEAWDADSDDSWQVNRNLHFRNRITEYGALVELNYLDHRLGNPEDRIGAYLFTGLAVYAHMPEAEIDGTWYALQPLGTEGQGTTWGEARGLRPYTTAGMSLPIGFGFKVNVGPAVAFNVEWGVRKTWNDYLDDVSTTYADVRVLRAEKGDLAATFAERMIALPDGREQAAGLQRGDPGKDDAYGFVTASLCFRVSKKPTTCAYR